MHLKPTLLYIFMWLLFRSNSLFAVSNYLTLCENHLKKHPTFQSADNEYIIVYSHQSAIGQHIKFQHQYRKVVVQNSTIDFHFYARSNRLVISDNLLGGVELLPIPYHDKLLIVFDKDRFSYAIKTLVKGPYSAFDTIKILSLTGELISQRPTRIFLHGPDTLIKLPVFSPNPIETSNTKYGATLKDAGDANSNAFNKNYFYVDVPLRKYANGYKPSAKHFKYTEVSPPFDSAFVLPYKHLPKSRSDAGFETINSSYHLVSYAQYLTNLGFGDLIDSIHVDAHALNGDDQSAFNGFTIPVTLEFGQGGVDDAEDAHVVIHEFAHSLGHKAQPFGYEGLERKAMEEGNADFLAMSYSNILTGSNRSNIFTWDGHNEFWDGFTINSEKNYLDGMKNMHQGREIWSSVLFCIAEAIGWQNTEILVLEQLYYQAPNMSMPQTAKNILMLDTMLYGGMHYKQIKSCFVQKHMLQYDVKDVAFLEQDSLAPMILNNNAWKGRDLDLTIFFKQKTNFEYAILDVSGRTILSERVISEVASINKEHLPSGLYFLRIRRILSHIENENFFVFKIVI